MTERLFSADGRQAVADECAGVLERLAPAAGLDATLAPFAGEGTLAERLSANPYLMAPMAGVSDAAYRMMARAGGAAIGYTEMVSVAGIHYAGEKTWDLVYPKGAEPDVAVQLFGSKPEQFREAAALVCERVGERLALIDVNMACPVPKVTRKGEGSALLDEPDRAADIVRSCLAGLRDAGSDVPVTVKIRAARRTGDVYRGEADWGVVSRVVDAVSIPVIGSGDVLDAEAASRMRAETGATAVMVARGTYGNPWVFAGARDVDAGREPHTPTLSERLGAFECHVRLLAATGAHLARGRSLAGWYLKGMPHAAAWRNRAMACVTLEDFLEMVEALRAYVDAAEGEL